MWTEVTAAHCVLSFQAYIFWNFQDDRLFRLHVVNDLVPVDGSSGRGLLPADEDRAGTRELRLQIGGLTGQNCGRERHVNTRVNTSSLTAAGVVM